MSEKAGKATEIDAEAVKGLQPVAFADAGGSLSPEKASQALYTKLCEAKFSRDFWLSLSVEQMLRFDYKQYEEGSGITTGGAKGAEAPVRYGIASILLTIEDVVGNLQGSVDGDGDDDDVDNDDGGAAAATTGTASPATATKTLIASCVDFCARRSLDFVLVMTMVLGDDGTPQRQLLAVAPSSSAISISALSEHCNSGGVELAMIDSEVARLVGSGGKAEKGEGGEAEAIARSIVDGRNSRKKVAPAVAAFVRSL